MIRSFNRSMLAPVLAVSVTMASCPAALADERAVKVGFAGGMTGACGSIVKSELQGVEMAIAELNAKDGILGRQVVLIKRDTQTKPDEGAKVARDLIVNEKIDVLTGVCSSSVLLAVTAVSKETRTPFYSTVGNTQKANFEAYQPYFWQTQANAWMEARAAALLVASHTEWKTVTPIGFDYEWGHTSVGAFTDALKLLRPDMTVTEPVFPKLGESNMGPYITATLSRQPDAVFAAVFGGGLESLVKQGAGYGLFTRSNLVTLMTVDAMQALSVAIPKSHIYGVARAPFNALLEDPSAAEFVHNFKTKYGAYPTDWAVLGYDGLMFYAAAAKQAGSVDRDAIVKAVGEINYDGLRGKGLKVRVFDGQMNAASYTGAVAFDSKLGLPVLQDVERVSGDDLLVPENVIEKIRKGTD